MSLVLKGMYNVGVNSKGSVCIDDKTIGLKDIPFVRYRFKVYGESELEYIKESIKKFKYSIHMIEMTISESCLEELQAIENGTGLENVVKYVYVPVDDQAVLNVSIGDTYRGILEDIYEADIMYDRLMIKDNSSTLQYIIANKLKEEISSITEDDIDDIGVCGSPLSFDEQACLTALRARELAAEYSVNEEMALPTANHQCMECCGCIRYTVIDNDIPVMEGKKKGSSNDTSGNNNKSSGKKAIKGKTARAVKAFNWQL